MYYSLGIVLLMLAGLSSANQGDSQLSEMELSNARLVAGGEFSNKLYQEVFTEAGNSVMSPLSAKIVLTQAYTGARDTTADEMKQGLDLPHDDTATKEGMKSLLTLLKSDEDVILKITNRMFVENTYHLEDTFKSDSNTYFLSQAEAVDFANNYEEARQHINSWVEEKTNNTIKNLIPEGAVDSNTVLALVNALYLKASWLYPFKSWATSSKPFHVSANEAKHVNMMSMSETSFNYANLDDLEAKAIELPYKGNRLSMLVILPNDVNGLPGLEEKLKTRDIGAIVCNESAIVDLQLPKFKIEKNVPLNDLLKKLGMKLMFEHTANFSGISEPSPYVSSVIQKAFIEVDEAGTIAAAATAILFVPFSAPAVRNPWTLAFHADHPFLFAVRETSSGAILFVGRLTDPYAA